jgi:hypothetical protein
MNLPTIAIVKQEFPETTRPYRLLETHLTSEGPRTRVCSGAFSTFDDANNWRADLVAEMPRPIVAQQQCGGDDWEEAGNPYKHGCDPELAVSR